MSARNATLSRAAMIRLVVTPIATRPSSAFCWQSDEWRDEIAGARRPRADPAIARERERRDRDPDPMLPGALRRGESPLATARANASAHTRWPGAQLVRTDQYFILIIGECARTRGPHRPRVSSTWMGRPVSWLRR